MIIWRCPKISKMWLPQVIIHFHWLFQCKHSFRGPSIHLSNGISYKNMIHPHAIPMGASSTRTPLIDIPRPAATWTRTQCELASYEIRLWTRANHGFIPVTWQFGCRKNHSQLADKAILWIWWRPISQQTWLMLTHRQILKYTKNMKT